MSSSLVLKEKKKRTVNAVMFSFQEMGVLKACLGYR